MVNSAQAIKMNNVTIRYKNGVEALKDASLVIPEGVFCAVLGMNGAGKSTLFRTILGLEKPVAGTVLVDQKDATQARKKGLVSYMPQTEQVDWDFPITVFDLVLMGRYSHMGPMRVPSKKDIQATNEALETVGMIQFKQRQIGELSGGQKKRIFLARALAHNAPILLLDEPFAGVDAATERQLTQVLIELKEKGKTILMSIHELTSLSSYCDYVALIKETVIAAGPTKEVFTKELVSKTFDGLLHNLKFD